MTDDLMRLAEEALADLIARAKSDLEETESGDVRAVLEISVSLAEKIGVEAFEIVDAVLEGKPFDEVVLGAHLSLLQVSNLLDVAQGLEARQRASFKRIVDASKAAGVQIVTTLIKSALVLV